MHSLSCSAGFAKGPGGCILKCTSCFLDHFSFFNQLCLTPNFKMFRMLPAGEKEKWMLSDSMGKFSCKGKSFLF